MADAPFSLYVDISQVSSITTSAGTATLTTAQSHGLISGDYIQIEGVATTPAWNNVYQIVNVPNGTQAKFVTGTTGAAAVTSAVASRNLLNPLANYASAERNNAAIVPIGSITMSKSGDGGSNSFGFAVLQDATPAEGPWFSSLPDNARTRLVKCNTTTKPDASESDVQFKGLVGAVSSTLSGGGQGSITQVTVDDVNVLLDKLTIHGAPSKREISSMDLNARQFQVTTKTPHIFAASATAKIRFKGVLAPHSSTTKATKTAINQPAEFTVSSVGSDGSTFETAFTALLPNTGSINVGSLAIGSASRVVPSAIRNDLTRITVFPATNFFHNLTAADVGTGVFFSTASGSGLLLEWLLDNEFVIDKIVAESAGGGVTLQCKSTRPRPATGTLTLGALRSYPEVDLVTPAGVGEYLVGAQTSETAIIQQFFTKALQQNYQYDATLKRLFDVTDTSGIAALSGKLPEAVIITADTLKSALDTVVEQFSGIDGLERRYWIGVDKTLYYATTSGTAVVPTYADAPLKIITSGAGSPEGTPSTIAARELSVESRHSDIIKRAQVYPKTGAQSAQLYNQLGYTTRSGPILEARLDAPLATTKSGVQRAAKAFFLENSKQIVSGSFTLAGLSTASYNEFGYMGGIYQTGATAYATASAWEPGQFVSVTAPSLSLSGLYRVETVDVAFERSSFSQRITIGFARRPVGTLSDIVRGKK